MHIAIFADEARPGDILIPEHGAMQKRVLTTKIREDGGCEMVLLNLETATAETVTRSRNAALILLHRPWPEGQTEADMLEAVEAALRRCAHAQIENDGRRIGAYLELWRSTNLGENLLMLREAIEAYELGRPAKQVVLGVSSDRAEAEVDASCGYLGGGPVGC